MKRLSVSTALVLLLTASLVRAEAPRVEPGGKKLPLPGEALLVNGCEAFVILPDKAEGPVPWVWYAPTLPGLPAHQETWMFERFLAAGVAVAGIDVGESYGSPEGRRKYQEFYTYLTGQRGFSPKPCLLARSRGGLMLYSWAVEHPEKVAGVAGIYPVCNIASYPGVAKAAGAYALEADQLAARLTEFNPVDRLAPLARAGVPLLHLHGDKDKVVPLEENSALLAERYRALGGPVEVEVVPGGGHDVNESWFHSEKLTAFAIARARGEKVPGGID